MNELKNELKIELSCGNCSFTKTITIVLDKDGVFTISNKFCPRDLSELKRDVLRQFVSEPKPELIPTGNFISDLKPVPEPKSDEPTEDKTRTPNSFSKPARPVDLSKHGANSSKKN